MISIQEGRVQLWSTDSNESPLKPRVSLLGDDLLKLSVCSKQTGYWSRTDVFVPVFEPHALAGVWTCEFLYGDSRQVVELEFPRRRGFL